MPFLGTIVNAITVIVGALVGSLLSRLFSKNHKLASIPNSAMKAVSLVVIYIGIKGALDSQKGLVILLSIVVGSTIGTIIDIDGALDKFGSFIERKIVRNEPQKNANADDDTPTKSVSKGFVSTTLTCCVGALAIMGALNSGLSNGENQELLYTKSVLDFITALVFSSAFGGVGAMLASIPVILYQGIIELAASGLSDILTSCINEISAVGSLIVVALGLNMIGATKVKIANLLPSVFLPILFCQFL